MCHEELFAQRGKNKLLFCVPSVYGHQSVSQGLGLLPSKDEVRHWEDSLEFNGLYVLRSYEKDLREINNKRLQRSYDVTVNRDKKKRPPRVDLNGFRPLLYMFRDLICTTTIK